MNHTEAATQITIAVLANSPSGTPEYVKNHAVDTYKAIYEAVVKAAQQSPASQVPR